MRITDVKPFVLKHGRNFLFVKVETDQGIYGIGEAGLTWQEGAVSETVLRLKRWLVGEDPFRTEHLWQVMFRGAFFPGGNVLSSAISAIDLALWDIKGKALDQPLYNLIGGLCRDKVVCYPHNGGGSIDALVESCRRSVDEGWKFVRWGVEADAGVLEPSAATRRTVAQFDAVRGALGDDLELLIDIHTRLDPPDAIRLCRELEPYRPFFVEDPLRAESPEAYRALAPHVHVPLAVGEHWPSKWEFRALIEEDLMHYARIDLCIAGGMTEALKIARWCETHYINLAPHNPLGPVSGAAGLHLCLASTNVGVLELPRRPGTVLPEAFPSDITWDDGYLLAPTAPGLGVEINEDAFEQYAPDLEDEAPRLHRADGAFTNW
ncbi:galactonate dehydratase [Candidatus Poribacteria bacterium]|jgi:L-alanine-DL-glutamate epimerase-like enolase superfamily enzyme|nr:galactonate dehydratase [Candidatus Poribacteria bacterium]MBT5536783.1 galactonate dehydratase [Candidatus Poribacteria bacterium]MBT5714817.1 galactonate dehydratase [Candidatus Poribacteria bacterium]MBT7100822.1 galactonate dehydratase [Candidatus Poribacteria bacterium]MBT7806321.1 galactonate dehydratase [Candidatus Poribacteria bacterium]